MVGGRCRIRGIAKLYGLTERKMTYGCGCEVGMPKSRPPIRHMPKRNNNNDTWWSSEGWKRNDAWEHGKGKDWSEKVMDPPDKVEDDSGGVIRKKEVPMEPYEE